MVKILVDRDGMDPEDAQDYLGFNTVGAWLGPGTPIFLDRKPAGIDGRDWLAERFEGGQ